MLKQKLEHDAYIIVTVEHSKQLNTKLVPDQV